jgi:hypothetical protein
MASEQERYKIEKKIDASTRPGYVNHTWTGGQRDRAEEMKRKRHK